METQSIAKFTAVSTLFYLSLIAGSPGCSEPEPGGSVPTALRADLQLVLDDAVDREVTPGMVLHVAGDDGESWSGAAGRSNLQRDAPMALHERFRAGSIAKTFVATAVLQAVEAGELELDDRLTEWLPTTVTARIENAESIDLRMLLGHRSGIPEWVGADVHQAIVVDPEHVWSLDEILDRATSQPAEFAPGERYGYSNTNYILLGEVLSGATGRSWREVVRERVIARAGLEHTTLPEVGDPATPEDCAHGYLPFEGELLDLSRVDPSMAGASGGHALITSTADLTRFFQQLRSGALFDRASTLETMFAFESAPDPESQLVGYGLGVMQLEADGAIALGHLGTTAGYRSFMLYVPETDRYVAGFVNVMGDFGAVLAPVLARVAQP